MYNVHCTIYVNYIAYTIYRVTIDIIFLSELRKNYEKINPHSKAEIIAKLTIHSHCYETILSPAKFMFFKSRVRAGLTKLRHTTLEISV